jgi:hypothetical protein
MDVTLAASVDEFFHEVVTDALLAVDLDASEPAGWYLVGLLGEFTTARLTDEPLGLKLAAPCVAEIFTGPPNFSAPVVISRACRVCA